MKIVRTAFFALATLTCFNMTSLTGPKAAYGFDNSSVWMVTSFGKEVITNLDVHDYIDAMMTSDLEVISLHKSSKNYDEFYKKNFEIKKSKYDEGLKRMLTSRMLEREALRKDKRQTYFRITQSQYTNRITEKESEILKEYLDKKMGIVKAREEYGKLLLAKGIHKKNDRETPTDVYMRFYEREKRRILETMREEEARKYQIGEAQRYSHKLPLSHLANDDFGRATTKLINDNLNHKFTTQEKISDFMNKNPDVGVLINNVQIYTLERTPLSKIKADAPKYFDKVTKIANDFIKKEEGENLKIRNYQAERSLQIAEQFSNQYDRETLEQRRAEALKMFVSGSDYNTFVLSKLYDLAIKIQELDKSKRAPLYKEALVISEKARKDAHKKLLSSDLTKEHQGYVFEDIYLNAIQSSGLTLIEKTSFSAEDKTYLTNFLSVVNWNSKFEALKLAKAYREVYVIASAKDPFKNGMYDIIRNYLTAKYIKEELDKRHKNFIQSETSYLHINLYGKGRVGQQELIDFLMK
jgi:hypothetical protein